jgi:ribosome-associated protein
MKAKAPKKTVKTAKPAKPVKTARVAGKTKPSERLLKLIVAALDDKKAEDLRVLDVSKLSSITDFLVLATGGSEPHLRALRIELERVLDAEKARILGVDTSKGSGWTVVDAFEIMIHVFTPENRDKYRMELLWRDATELSLAKILK